MATGTRYVAVFHRAFHRHNLRARDHCITLNPVPHTVMDYSTHPTGSVYIPALTELIIRAHNNDPGLLGFAGETAGRQR